jgi:hypothetical protein
MKKQHIELNEQKREFRKKKKKKKTSLSRSNPNASCAFTILNKTNKQSNDMFLSFQGHIQGTKLW